MEKEGEPESVSGLSTDFNKEIRIRVKVEILESIPLNKVYFLDNI